MHNRTSHCRCRDIANAGMVRSAPVHKAVIQALVRQWTMRTMTCPHCGYQWESYARSQTSRCGRCRATVYVPAAVRNAGAGMPARPVRVAPDRRPAAPVPVRSEAGTAGDTDDGAGYGPGRGPGVRRARPYATVTTTPAPTLAPASVRVIVGAVGRWRCGHVGNVLTYTTSRDPGASRCRECGAVGLVAQLTPEGGWAPLAVEHAPDVQAPVPPAVVVPMFAGVPSPSAAAGLDYWRGG